MNAPAAECDLREMTVITNGCLAAQGTWQASSEVSLKGFNDQIAEREPDGANGAVVMVSS